MPLYAVARARVFRPVDHGHGARRHRPCSPRSAWRSGRWAAAGSTTPSATTPGSTSARPRSPSARSRSRWSSRRCRGRQGGERPPIRLTQAPGSANASAVPERRHAPPIPFRDPETRGRFKRVADAARIGANAGLDRFVPAIPESAAFAFVLGCGHSGTTLVASRLGNHPRGRADPGGDQLFEPRRPLGRARRSSSERWRRRGGETADAAGEDAEARAGHRAAAPAPARGAADRGGAESARHLPVASEARRHARGGDRPLVRRQRRGIALDRRPAGAVRPL